MRILHIGNGNEKHLGKRFYDVGRKLQHGLIRSGHNTLFFSDRDVARTSGLCGTKLKGKERANAKLLQVADNFKPEMVLLGHADIITNDTLEKLREKSPHLRIAQFNVDPVFRPENHAAICHRIPYIDASFITTGGVILEDFYAEKHIASYIPNPVDSAIECYKAHENPNCEYDVFYAVRATTTTGSQETNDRLTIPRYIRDEGAALNCHFHGFDNTPELFGAAFYSAIASCAMGLNLSHKQTTKGNVIQATDQQRYLYSSDRISQYLGNGLLTFTQRGFGLEALFEEDEVIFFKDRTELLERCLYFKGNPTERMKIARNGWRKAHEHHSAQHVAQYIVDVTMQQSYSHKYHWDITHY